MVTRTFYHLIFLYYVNEVGTKANIICVIFVNITFGGNKHLKFSNLRVVINDYFGFLTENIYILCPLLIFPFVPFLPFCNTKVCTNFCINASCQGGHWKELPFIITSIQIIFLIEHFSVHASLGFAVCIEVYILDDFPRK